MAKAAAKKAAGEAKVILKTPKGTRDFGPRQMAIRENVISTITEIFKRHGAETIDTPVFELREVLMGKYGEEGSKLVFDLVDQGGELCSLRYDLTVPFARYLAMNKITNLKRYQIAKVYRRDQPVMTKGRYREFYQCDFDIAGQYDLMVPEAECLKIADEVLSALNIGDYEIKLNHRLLLEGMFEISGIPMSEFKAVCSSVDKLDKQSWNEIEYELINEKKIPEEAVKKLEQFVRLREMNSNFDSASLLKLLSPEQQQPDGDNSTTAVGTGIDPEMKLKRAVDELRALLSYTACMECTPGRIVFEPALARGLDYYTGAIYEVVIKEFSFNAPQPAPDAGSTAILSSSDSFTTASKSTKVEAVENNETVAASGPIGSVAAGGRYDHLVSMFHVQPSSKKKDTNEVPCVGISFGIERLFSIMELKAATDDACSVKVSPTDVFVASAQKNLMHARMGICARLWAAQIRTEFSYKVNPKMLSQFQYCEDRQIPWALIVGEREMEQKCVKLRNIATREEEDVNIDELIDVLRKKLRTDPSEVGK